MHDHSLLQAECCASSPVFSQHVTSHLRVPAALQPCGLCVRRDPADAESILHVHVNAEMDAVSNVHHYLSHAPGFCVRLASMVGTCFCDASGGKSERTETRNIRQKVPWRRLLFMYMHLRLKADQMRHVCCSFLNACFDPTDAGGELGLAWSN